MTNMTPREIVHDLDKHIIGQDEAKRAVAIALRNRWRRMQLDEELRAEISPKNILMIGPTGVGKTEIARRLASLANAPFIKIEASKFTEVGYVGRDVESIIRDLIDIAVNMIRSEKEIEVIQQAEKLAQEKILDILFPVDRQTERKKSPEAEQRYQRNRQRLKKKLEKGDFEDKVVELDISSDFATQMQVFGPFGMEEIGTNLKDMLSNIMPGQKKRRKMSIKAARKILTDAEAHNLIDQDEIGIEKLLVNMGKLQENIIIKSDNTE